MPEIGILFPVPLQERAIAQIFKPPTAIRHCSLKNFTANSQQYITRRHTAELAVCSKIRCCDRLRKIDRGGPVNNNSPPFQKRGKIIQQLVCPINGFLRAASPLSAHVAVLWHLCIQCRFSRRNMTVICPPDNYMLQGIPLIPTIYNRFHLYPVPVTKTLQRPSFT